MAKRRMLHKLYETGPRRVKCMVCKKEFHQNFDNPLLTTEECSVRLRYLLDAMDFNEEEYEQLLEEKERVDAQYQDLSLEHTTLKEKVADLESNLERIKTASTDASTNWGQHFEQEVHWAQAFQKRWEKSENDKKDVQLKLQELIVEAEENGLDSLSLKLRDLWNQVGHRLADTEKFSQKYQNEHRSLAEQTKRDMEKVRTENQEYRDKVDGLLGDLLLED